MLFVPLAQAEEGDAGAEDEQDDGDRDFEHEGTNGAAHPEEQGKEIEVPAPSEKEAIVNGTIPTADE